MLGCSEIERVCLGPKGFNFAKINFTFHVLCSKNVKFVIRPFKSFLLVLMFERILENCIHVPDRFVSYDLQGDKEVNIYGNLYREMIYCVAIS